MMCLSIRIKSILCILLFFCLYCIQSHASQAVPCTQQQHQFESEILFLNTEEQEGQVRNTCVHCGYSYIEYLPATGHHFGEWQVELEMEDGSKKELRTCQGCGRSETRVVSADKPLVNQISEGENKIMPKGPQKWKPNRLDALFSAGIGCVWGYAAVILWYNGQVLNWYKEASRKKERRSRK